MLDQPDLIHLRGLRVVAFCGVLPEEQARAQPFEIDVDVLTDVRAPGATDQLDDTIDYGTLGRRIVDLAATERYALLERFSTRIAELVLEHPAAHGVTVTVRKLRPPVDFDLASSGVTITRTRT